MWRIATFLPTSYKWEHYGIDLAKMIQQKDWIKKLKLLRDRIIIIGRKYLRSRKPSYITVILSFLSLIHWIYGNGAFSPSLSWVAMHLLLNITNMMSDVKWLKCKCPSTAVWPLWGAWVQEGLSFKDVIQRVTATLFPCHGHLSRSWLLAKVPLPVHCISHRPYPLFRVLKTPQREWRPSPVRKTESRSIMKIAIIFKSIWKKIKPP